MIAGKLAPSGGKKPDIETEIAIIGAGVAGIATAYYLCRQNPRCQPVILDVQNPMGLTSAQSGENYRNWWPHPTMAAFTNQSIGLMESIARETNNTIAMTRRGYALATRRQKVDDLVDQLYDGYGTDASALIRFHNDPKGNTYSHAPAADWQEAPDGVDVLQDQNLIRRVFPSFSHEVSHVLHIRRAGDISSQQLGQFMLEKIKQTGGKCLTKRVVDLDTRPDGFAIQATSSAGDCLIHAEKICIAAGPFAPDLASMLGVELPIENVFQQKIAFEDRLGAIPRQMPFAIDLDELQLDWDDEERALLAGDRDMAWLAKTMPGGMHCRPDGGSWVRLGWAFNVSASEPVWEPDLNPQYPEIVLRAASRLNPALKAYYGHFPRNMVHYGGYYTMTKENWPLIGPLGVDGAYVVGALSGFGTMVACGAGELCASWMNNQTLPEYARDLSPLRYENTGLINNLQAATDRGIL